jgi:4a-hydroxytetrahydrobiopterin dehydratase
MNDVLRGPLGRSRSSVDDGAVPRPPRLSPDEIAVALHGLPAWSGDGDGIRRTVELPSFQDAVAAIVAIADVAEEMDHHPDIDLRWRTLHLTLVSHSAGGVSELDLELARRIDALLPG